MENHFVCQLLSFALEIKTINSMKNRYKVMTGGLLPDAGLVFDIETIRMFSEFCEETCSNLFAFSPYQLHIEREAFLHFQYIADELESLLGTDDVQFAELAPLCANLHSVYCDMMNGCWDAFVYNADIHGEPGKFIVQQLVFVDAYEKKVREYKKGF